jgi:hypothetical protein
MRVSDTSFADWPDAERITSANLGDDLDVS